MNTSTNPMPESLPGSITASSQPPNTRPFYWSVRRELWENRSVYFAPMGVAAVFLLGFLITLIHFPAKMRALSGLDPARFHAAVATHYDVAAALMMATIIIVSVFYCADALHSERRDRSILFWKSLPVSDLNTVLAKVSIPLVILPVIACAITAALWLTMLLLSSAVLLGSGLSVSTLWAQLPLPKMWLLLVYHLFTAHALWPLPVYCWLLLVSGWARRAVFLWAALPLVAIAGVERIVFHTSHFAALVASRLIGATPGSVARPEAFPTDPMAHIAPGHFLSSPGLWIGLAVAAAFLAAAVWMRRYQEPI